jgi:hypothetical protein
LAAVGADGVQLATGTLVVLLGVQVVVVQLLPAPPTAAVHDDTPVGAVVRIGHVVVV